MSVDGGGNVGGAGTAPGGAHAGAGAGGASGESSGGAGTGSAGRVTGSGGTAGHVSSAGASSGGASSGGASGAGGSDACLFSGFQGDDYTVLVADDMVSLQVTPDEFDNISQLANPGTGKWPPIIANLFKDDFDFHLYLMNRGASVAGAEAQGSNLTVHTAAKGLGFSTGNLSNFAAWPNLLSIVFLGRSYDLASGNILHEIMHTWGNALIPEGDGGHWPQASDIDGQLGGGYVRGSLRLVSGNTYVATRSEDTGLYADIELYMAGLLPASAVTPLSWLSNPVYVSTNDAYTEDTYTADGIVTRDIDTIVASNGVRTPDSTQSKHDFRALVVVITPRPLSAADWFFYRTQAGFLTNSDAVDVTFDPNRGSLFAPGRLRYSLISQPRSFHHSTRDLGTLELDGLTASMLDASTATCVDTQPETSNACAVLAARAEACGIPLAPCDIDGVIPPDEAACIADCASNDDCDDLTAAVDVQPVASNTYLWCASQCQCVADQGCTKL